MDELSDDYETDDWFNSNDDDSKLKEIRDFFLKKVPQKRPLMLS